MQKFTALDVKKLGALCRDSAKNAEFFALLLTKMQQMQDKKPLLDLDFNEDALASFRYGAEQGAFTNRETATQFLLLMLDCLGNEDLTRIQELYL